MPVSRRPWPPRPFWPRSPQIWLVAAASGWQLWTWRAERLPVAYLYDGAVHEQMTRFATATIEAGHLPFTSWFPYIGLGSPQYSEYQSLPSIVTGLAGVVVGAGTAYRWSLYLLVALWPFAVYGAGRLMGLSRGASAAAALLSQFVVSFTGIGFEQNAYSYIGGAEVWTQLFGGWALAFAWAASWRAFREPRYLWLASGLGGLTIVFHFECGYLALLGVMVMALAGAGPWLRRLLLGAVMLAGSLAAAAWAIVPLMLGSEWSAIDQLLAKTVYVRGYGARRELEWLVRGQIFDARRAVPVISVLVAAGVVVAVVRWRRRPLERSLLALFAACLVLSFGPTTFGPLADLVPAHGSIYFRRFTMGTQLAGLYLAGTAISVAWGLLERGRARLSRWVMRSSLGAPSSSRPVLGLALQGRLAHFALVGCAGAAFLAWLYPAGRQLYLYDQQDAAVIQAQRHADATAGAELTPLVAYAKRHGGGRVYAGLAGNWGQDFLVGVVPLYKYLLSYDVEEMAYVVPSLSLMLVPEAEFDESNLADYSLFGVRYLVLPTGEAPLVRASFVMARGPYSLWELPGVHYVEPVRVDGRIVANRADVGPASLGLLHTLVPGEDSSVDWPGAPRATQSAAPAGGHVGSTGHALPPATSAVAVGARDAGPPGVVESVHADLRRGTVAAEVDMSRAGSLLLSTSYVPGWHVSVDGRPARTVMLAPALPGVRVPKGVHRVVFRYEGFGWYPELWSASALSLVALWYAGRRLPLRKDVR
ncbi:MAG: YfhO family protein [Actinomycetota bacterium]|nr:YfhO family protein [Actinomycetota bacterium]